MFDGLTAGARGPEVGAKGDASDKISGKGPGAPPDGGSPGIVGQIFDGHGGWKPPVINSPFGDKSGAKTGDVENDKGSSKPAPMGGRIADTRIPDDRREGKIAGGKTPAEALIGIIESVKGGIGGGIRLGQFGKADQVGKTNKVDQQDPIGSPNKLTTSGRELTLTGVKTKAWPIAQDGSTITTVAMLTPFLSGANSGLRITKNITKGSTTDTVTRPIMIGSKLGPMLIGPDTKLDDSQFVGGDTVEMPHLNLKYVGDSPDREVEAGRLKSRPSVNMHLPGGTYAGSKEEAKAESGIHANAHPDAYAHASAQAEADATTEANGIIPPGKGAPALPWLSTGDNEIRDNSKTVVNIPAQAPLESMRSRRPAKAIDELESTLEMESPAKLVRERANAHLKEKAKEPSDELARNVSNELPEEQTNDRPPEPTSEQALGQLQNDDRYKYIVQQGDTVESVALNVLLDPMLAGLLFGINRRYVLPEEQYGLHPLMVGVVIQLPTPGEIIKFRQAQ
jgi:hypothetical protein